MNKPGTVYIIGAGPGDPGLITVRGAECLSRADVVVYDYLVSGEILRGASADARLVVSGEILRGASADARLVYVGKIGGRHNIAQEDLNQILVDEVLKGNTVVRLKGGDPFIFGRGGEEAEYLQQAGIPFEVVPGVTSAIAAPAYAGIPLTHRAFTSTVAFVTGHEDPAKNESAINWRGISTIGTLVFLMGVKNLPRITARLIENGRDPATPAALIRWGTTPDQETLTGTLGDIAALAEEQHFSPPALCVVGEVVSLRRQASPGLKRKPSSERGSSLHGRRGRRWSFPVLLAGTGSEGDFLPGHRDRPSRRLWPISTEPLRI